MSNRYNRHIILSEIGKIGQNKLNQAKVLVIGAGGLGCPVLQYLAAAGIGNIGIIDFDVVDISNLQRQILYGTSTLGKNKAEAAKARLEDLNSDISIVAYPEKLTHKNALDLFKLYDIIVDGSDNFETRYLVNDACIIANKPLVFGAIYKFEGHISVFNYKNGPSYRCLFPEAPTKGSAPNCSEIGVLGVLPGIIGTMQANEVLKIILELGNSLSGKLFCYNALTLENTTLTIKRSENTIQSVLNDKENFHLKTIDLNCEIEVILISMESVISENNIQLIDVREEHEEPKIDNFPVTHIPLSKLESHLDKIDQAKKKALFCQSGMRSKRAVELLQEHNILNCYSITEGASDIKNIIIEHSKMLQNER